MVWWIRIVRYRLCHLVEAGARLLWNASPLPEESVRRTEATFHAEALLTFFRASVDVLGLRAILGGVLG